MNQLLADPLFASFAVGAVLLAGLSKGGFGGGVGFVGVLALARLRARTVSMTNALIMANLTLEQAEVTKGVDLSGSEIMGGYWADGARLGAVVTDGCDLHGRQHNWEATVA